MVEQATVAEIDDLEEEVGHKGAKKKLSDQKLSKLYDETSARIIQDRSDFMLPQIRDLVQKQRWINPNPDYQRRHRWDDVKQSRLIESLLMNAPIPPIFLYETELNRYEVMDGQQRLTSIVDFYKGDLRLKGLTVWKDLDGRTFDELPTHLQRGLDRRRISAVVLLAESSQPDNDQYPDIRKEVFERLNTGGTALNHQELRNCVFAGPFNRMIIELASGRRFCRMWDIPPHKAELDRKKRMPKALRENKLFQTMGDCQIVLRFFAFKDAENIRGSVKRMLDNSMRSHQSISDSKLKELRNIFDTRLALVEQVFGRDAFKLPEQRGGGYSRPLFDALMVAIDRLWDRRDRLIRHQSRVRHKLEELLSREKTYEVIIGRPNTAAAVNKRITLIERSLKSATA